MMLIIIFLISPIQTPEPGDPLVDFYSVNISSTIGQQLCGSQTTGGNINTVMLDVTGCAICQGSYKSYAVTVQASNRGGQTTSTTSLCKTTHNFSVHVMQILVKYIIWVENCQS